MSDRRSREGMKELGAGRPAPDAVAALYRKAFEHYGAQALWSRRPSAEPTVTQALVVADSLRREGNVAARGLAEQIEDACRATL